MLGILEGGPPAFELGITGEQELAAIAAAPHLEQQDEAGVVEVVLEVADDGQEVAGPGVVEVGSQPPALDRCRLLGREPAVRLVAEGQSRLADAPGATAQVPELGLVSGGRFAKLDLVRGLWAQHLHTDARKVVLEVGPVARRQVLGPLRLHGVCRAPSVGGCVAQVS
ncbi:MAG: hypothetical protein GY925_20675 [Actinomycetia bacterium]|nr:hypothetical protein [Actinomycetes bacterium]